MDNIWVDSLSKDDKQRLQAIFSKLLRVKEKDVRDDSAVEMRTREGDETL